MAMLVSSEGVINAFKVDWAIAVTETGKLTIFGDVKWEAVTLDTAEFIHNLASKLIEALCTDLIIATACKNQVLRWYESHGVNDRVEDVATRGSIPDHLFDRLCQVTEIPQLDTFTECATASHHIHIVMRDVDTIATDGSLSSNWVRHTVCSDIPEAYLTVPGTRKDHVGRLGVELTCENFVRMSRVNLVSKLLDLGHAVFIVNFNVWLSTCNYESASITRVVNGMILLFFIKHNMFNLVAHLWGPAHDTTIKACSE